VQSGVGLTGRFWAHQHFGVEPDLLAFGKKMQICGMIAGGRIDTQPDNVFHVSSRINSTWGGNLVDMVRSQRYLEIIEEERLVENAAKVGAHLLTRLQALSADRPGLVSNARGRGLMCAIDFPDGRVRDQVADKAYELGMVILPCGHRSLRFRPPLDITFAKIDEAVDIVGQAAELVDAKAA
jgi:L-lysine 6-transaminase